MDATLRDLSHPIGEGRAIECALWRTIRTFYWMLCTLAHRVTCGGDTSRRHKAAAPAVKGEGERGGGRGGHSPKQTPHNTSGWP